MPASLRRRIFHFPSTARSTAVLALLFALAFAGCGDDSVAPETPPPAGAAVRISPSRETLVVRDSVTLTAEVDSLTDKRVMWRVGPAGTGLDLGRLVVLSDNSARYIAPDRVTTALDLGVQVTAVSVADTAVRSTAVMTVPRLVVTVLPGSYSSVLPDTWVPFQVTVQNTTVPGFTLQVIAPGLIDPGTWEKTGPAITLYRAPSSVDVTAAIDLLARSEDDPDRFSIANLTMRRGFRVPSAMPSTRKYTPEWDPSTTRLAYVQGGPPWELHIVDVESGADQTVTTISWSGVEFDGRIAWSNDGTRLAFSESDGGGTNLIGYVGVDGSGRGAIAPPANVRYFEAAFVPERTPGEPDSLVIAEWNDGTSLLRVLSFALPATPGRVLYTATAGDTLRWPDATTISDRLAVAMSRLEGGTSTIISLVEDGTGPMFPVTGTGRRTQVRWAYQSTVPWITFIWDANHTAHRVRRTGGPVARLYSEFFPELSGDMVTSGGLDHHALSRRLPDGSVALYVVEFPPPDFTGTPFQEDRERASIGIPGPLGPSQWRTWLRTSSLVIGGLVDFGGGF